MRCAPTVRSTAGAVQSGIVVVHASAGRCFRSGKTLG